MISLIYCTARASHCFTHHPTWNQYKVLRDCCDMQRYRDFELVVVTPFVGQARDVLHDATIVMPRDTPWRRARMFAASSARNTGLTYASGDLVVSIDDCSTFEPDFLERIAAWWERGIGVSPIYRHESGTMNDMRWRWFLDNAGTGDSVIVRGEPYPQGFLAYPLEAAVRINGYNELFDGARGLEDVEFSARLISLGVPFAMDRNIVATLHDHGPYPEEIIDNANQNARCCNPTFAISKERGYLEANRIAYTDEEKRQVLNCRFWQDGQCGYWLGKQPCAYPAWGEAGHPVARYIMLDEGEPLFNLAQAREEAAYEEH